MNDTVSGANDAAQAGSSNGRLVILMIAGIPLTMILAATWLWFFVVNGELDLVGALGTANRGQLVQPPRQIADYGVQTDSGLPFELPDEAPRWVFVIPVSGDCNVGCESTLYTTRQIHQAMGKEQGRIKRLVVAADELQAVEWSAPVLSDGAPVPGSFPEYLETQQRGMMRAQLAAADYARLFAGEYPDNTWFLMDPAGWVMMAYTPDIHYKDVIADLKFLLKNSNG